MALEKIIDLLMFRQSSQGDSQSTDPKITVGSIVWGILLRSFLLVIIISLLLESMTMRQYWWFMLFAIWIFAAYPGWIQYKNFAERMKKFKNDTLCGSCRYFDENSQLCKIYDEHVSTNYLPCDGLNWEPANDDDS